MIVRVLKEIYLARSQELVPPGRIVDIDEDLAKVFWLSKHVEFVGNPSDQIREKAVLKKNEER